MMGGLLPQMAAARAVEAAAVALLSQHRASPGSATGGRSSAGLSRVPSTSLVIPLGWHPSSRARVASRLDATTTRRIAQSDGSRLGFSCQASCQMAPEIPLPGEGTGNRSRPQLQRGSRFSRSPLTLSQMDRCKQVSPERPNWRISSGGSRRHLQSHDRAGAG